MGKQIEGERGSCCSFVLPEDDSCIDLVVYLTQEGIFLRSGQWLIFTNFTWLYGVLGEKPCVLLHVQDLMHFFLLRHYPVSGTIK